MKDIFIQTITGYICAFISAICFALIYTLLTRLGANIDYGGDKAQVFFSMFLGLPIGSIIGFLLAQKIIVNIWHIGVVPSIIGVLISCVCVIVSIPLLDILGGGALLLFPLFATWSFMVTYRIASFFLLKIIG